MSRTPTGVDRHSVEQTLTDFANRVGGVVSFWTLVPFMDGFDSRGFIAENVGRLQASLASLREALVTTGTPERTPVRQGFDRMAAAVDRIAPVFAVFVEFRMAPPYSLREATEELRAIYETTVDGAREIGRELDLPSDVPPAGWGVREQQHYSVLDNLPTLFEQERAKHRASQ
jgi:hypothetical protein